MGRVTYERFRDNWSSSGGNPYFDHIAATPKYVASRSLDDVTWKASHLGPDIVTAIQDLKNAWAAGEDRIVSHERDGPADRGGRDPEIGVVIVLVKWVTDHPAPIAKLGDRLDRVDVHREDARSRYEPC
jgi:hypothetical protein